MYKQRLSICGTKRRIDNPLRPQARRGTYITAEILLLAELHGNTVEFNFSKFRNFYSRRRADRYDLRLVVQKFHARKLMESLSWAVISRCYPMRFQHAHKLLFIRYRERSNGVHFRTWVSQFCLFSRFSRETEKKTTRTRENWRNGRQRNFIRSRSYANLNRSSSQGASRGRRSSWIYKFLCLVEIALPFASSPTFSSFLPRYFVQSVTKMNKNVLCIIVNCCRHELIKMTCLVKPRQVFLALTESKMAEREKCRVVRSVLKFRYGYSGATQEARLFNHGSSAGSRAERNKAVAPYSM